MIKFTFTFALLLCAVLAVSGAVHRIALIRNTQNRDAYVSRALDAMQLREGDTYNDVRRVPLPLPRQRKKSGDNNDNNNQNADSNVISQIPLRGNQVQIGEVYAQFMLGTPPVLFSAQVDSGSSDLAVASTLCGKRCGQVATLYSASSSSSSSMAKCSDYECDRCHKNECKYSIGYADGSGYSAVAFVDRFSFDASSSSSLRAVNQTFGGIVSEVNDGEPFEPAGVDGIMGVGFRQLSEIGAPTPVDELVASGQISNRFAMCLTRDGGTMSLGGVAGMSHAEPLRYTPITEQLYYSVFVDDLRMHNRSLGVGKHQLNADTSIVDSGSTLVYVPTAAFDAFVDVLRAQCAGSHKLHGICDVRAGKSLFDGYCFSYTQAQIAQFPPLEIVFRGGGSATIAPNYYLVDGFCDKLGYLSLGIEGSDEKAVLLGDVFMKNVVSLFDRANMVYGFAPVTTCVDGNQVN
jgi:Eukaryotic aspartyl protease